MLITVFVRTAAACICRGRERLEAHKDLSHGATTCEAAERKRDLNRFREEHTAPPPTRPPYRGGEYGFQNPFSCQKQFSTLRRCAAGGALRVNLG